MNDSKSDAGSSPKHNMLASLTPIETEGVGQMEALKPGDVAQVEVVSYTHDSGLGWTLTVLRHRGKTSTRCLRCALLLR